MVNRRIACLRYLLLLVWLIQLAALCPLHSNAQTSGTEYQGSIQITPCTIEADHHVVPGTRFALYRVADVQIQNQTLQFTPTEAFSDASVDFQNFLSQKVAQSLLTYAQERKLQPAQEQSANEKGTVVFTSLPAGLYLLAQTNTVENYKPVGPFVISLPMQEENQWNYHVTAYPKVEQTPNPTDPTKPTTPPDPALPQTGQLNWPIPWLVLGGMSLFCGGWYAFFRKRDDHE